MSIPSAVGDHPGDVTFVRDEPSVRGPGVANPHWEREWPWLVHGVTTRRAPVDGADFRLFDADGSWNPSPEAEASWRALLDASGLEVAVAARQVHGREVRPLRSRPAGAPSALPGVEGLRLRDPCDGHVTGEAGVLLAVTVADCVPVLMVHPGRRVVAVVHAGWRGVAAGVLEGSLELMAREQGAPAGEVRVHLGPAICGRCYEVGPEVFEALGLGSPPSPAHLDLRRALVDRARTAGVDGRHISVSERCTRCERDVFYSHRGGDAGRQVAYIGVRS